MLKNYFKNFAVFLSDYLSFILLFATSFFIFYFLIFDTSFISSFVNFENELLLGLVCALASCEITVLIFTFFYFSLKKLYYFSRHEKVRITLHMVFRFFCLKIITFFLKILTLFMFLSPFLLSLSAIIILADNGVSETVFTIMCVCCICLFISGIMCFSVFKGKFSFLDIQFLSCPFLSFRKLYKYSRTVSDGNLMSFFRLKIKNIPKKILSLLIFPAVYYLPECLFIESDFIIEKENPYPVKADTEKSVVFYFDMIKEN